MTTFTIIDPNMFTSWRTFVETYPPSGWKELWDEVGSDLPFIEETLSEEEAKYGPWLPAPGHIFRAWYLTPLDDVKVVMVGHEARERELGLAFSSSQNDKLPISTISMYQELMNTIPGFVTPNHGDLTAWAYRGVLLINMSLTSSPGRKAAMREGKEIVGNHIPYWKSVIRRTLEVVYHRNRNAVFVFMGNEAQTLRPYLPGKALVVTAPYPGSKGKETFVGCGLFTKINKLLKEPINWNLE